MSVLDRTNITALSASDDTDDRRARQSRRRLENRRQRHNTRNELHRAAQYPIRRLLASA